MRFEADLLVQPLRLALNYRLVVTVYVHEAMLLCHSYLVAKSLQPEVWQVLAPVDPVPDGSLYAQHNRNEDLLDHFAILDTLWVS